MSARAVEPSSLTELRIEPELLYVIVAGPGYGEGICVAFPGSGWIVVDGCEVQGQSIPLQFIEENRRSDSDPLRLLVLSHPHRDHAAGFAKVVEALNPEAILLTARQPYGPHLLEEARAWMRGMEVMNTSDQLANRMVFCALKAVERWEDRHRGNIRNGIDGASFTWRVLGREVKLHVRAPQPGSHLDAIFNEIAHGNLALANEASLVLEVIYGATKIVLGGDMPYVRGVGGRTPMPTGWDNVMDRYPSMCDHTILKIPHHGSAEAFHPRLMSRTIRNNRVWVLTPFSPKCLPKIDNSNGIQRIARLNQFLDVTSPVASWDIQTSSNTRCVPLAAIRLRRQQHQVGDPFADDADDVGPLVMPSVFAPVCCYAFDDSAALRGCWLGSCALRIT